MTHVGTSPAHTFFNYRAPCVTMYLSKNTTLDARALFSLSSDKLKALRKYMHQSGTWNHHHPFGHDFADPFGHNLHNKLLPNYLATKKDAVAIRHFGT